MAHKNETPALAGDRGFEHNVIAGCGDTLEVIHSSSERKIATFLATAEIQDLQLRRLRPLGLPHATEKLVAHLAFGEVTA